MLGGEYRMGGTHYRAPAHITVVLPQVPYCMERLSPAEYIVGIYSLTTSLWCFD